MYQEEPIMTDDNPNPQAALKNLGQLIGTWDVELVFPTDPPGTVHEQPVFDWLEGGAFVIQHWGGSVWIIGPDDSSETYSTLYHDDRGVSRVYQMSLNNGVWKMWRNSPGFSQRFEGKFSEDGKTITAQWENSGDGSTWEHDFYLTYTKLS
jgi:hypothetical protein